MQNKPDSNASQTSFLHIDLGKMRELIGDAPDAELRLAELALGITRRQLANLVLAMERSDFSVALTSVRALRSTLGALDAEGALSLLKAVELFASLQDIAALKISVEQLAVEGELVCKNLSGQIARLKAPAA